MKWRPHYVPIAVENSTGYVRTEVIEDRDDALAAIESARAAAIAENKTDEQVAQAVLMLGRLSWVRLRWWIARQILLLRRGTLLRLWY